MEVLIKILKEQKLRSSGNTIVGGRQRGFICGDIPVVCFHDVPLYSVSENILHEQQLRSENPSSKIRYSPFGLRFDKRYIFKNGGRPVIYEKTDIAKQFLPPDEYWRIVRLDLDNDDAIIDWTHEREWRIKGYFDFELCEAEVLLSDQESVKSFYEQCEKQGMIHIFKEVKAIVTMRSLVL